MSGAGAHRGVGVQLVDAVYTPGDPRQTRRGDHDADAVAARHCPADAPWPPNHGNDHPLARAGAADESGFAEGQRVSAMGASNCGAVDPSSTLATDPELDFAPVPRRKSRRRPLLCHGCPLVTAVFRIMQPRGLPSTAQGALSWERLRSAAASGSGSSDDLIIRKTTSAETRSAGKIVMRKWLAIALASLSSAASAQQLPVLKRLPEAPEQPIPFSHRLHISNGLKCAECHPTPTQGISLRPSAPRSVWHVISP